jgi:hypothetical protein
MATNAAPTHCEMGMPLFEQIFAVEYGSNCRHYWWARQEDCIRCSMLSICTVTWRPHMLPDFSSLVGAMSQSTTVQNVSML